MNVRSDVAKQTLYINEEAKVGSPITNLRSHKHLKDKLEMIKIPGSKSIWYRLDQGDFHYLIQCWNGIYTFIPWPSKDLDSYIRLVFEKGIQSELKKLKELKETLSGAEEGKYGQLS